MSARPRGFEDGIPLAVSVAILRDLSAHPHVRVRTLARIHGVTCAVVRWAMLGAPRRRRRS